MGTSIKRSVGIRMACAIFAIFLFSGMTTMNILRIEGTQDDSVRASNMLDQVQAKPFQGWSFHIYTYATACLSYTPRPIRPSGTWVPWD